MSFLDVSLGDVRMVLSKGWKMAVAGETGSGKTTLLKTMAGLAQAEKGTVSFEGQRVLGPLEKLIPGHPGIAYLSQQFELPQHLRIEQVLEYANELPEEEAQELFRVCQIDHLMKRKTHQLSGGERQRIALAKLLIASPRLLLLDEPFSNLDMIHKEVLKSVIRDIGQRLDITCMLVSHDPLDTLSWADEILVLRDGKVVQQGPPMQVYQTPVDEYVAGLFGKYNLIDGRIVRPEQIGILSVERPGVLKGRIETMSFWGSFFEATVLTDSGLYLTVRVWGTSLAAGDLVYVTVP
ncbi:MAG: ABC transporter ATP-binding protein [Sphingobacteriales bacterium]|nr:ABC transporter ATP-binding protein [Sphingobacteriales bacterium]